MKKEVRAFGKEVEITNKTIATIEGGVARDLNGKLVKYSGVEAAAEAGETFIFTNPKTGNWTRSKNMPASGQAIVLEYIKQNKAVPVMENKVTNPVIALMTKAVENKPKDLFCTDLKWKFLANRALRGKNVMMTGAAGTGKTYTAQQVAKGLERPFFYFNLGATQDPRATLIGTTQFREGEGTLFNQSLFVKAIQTEGAVVLLDELSRANPEAANILMTVLDEGQRYLRLDEQEGAPTIKVANGVCFIATANIGNEYTATRVMDRALMDRFTILEVDALTAEKEAELLIQNFPELDRRFADAIGEIAEMTRKELNTDNPRISTGISTRSTIELAGLMYDGFKLTEAAEVCVYPLYDNEGGADSERTFVKQIIQKYSHLDNPVVEATADGVSNDDDLFNLEDDSF